MVKYCQERERESERWQKRPEEVLRRFRKLRPGEAALSVITYGELLYGAAKSAQRIAALERLRDLCNCCRALLAGIGSLSVRIDSGGVGSKRRNDRKQRSLDRCACGSGRVDDGYKQRKRISARAWAEDPELGCLANRRSEPGAFMSTTARGPLADEERRIITQVCEMLLHEGVEAYKKEGPKFMQRLVAKQKARVKDS